jgi:hypothetical protein
MGYFDRLKTKWNIASNKQLFIIFVVFGLTGSSSVKIARPFLEYIGFYPAIFEDFILGGVLYWIIRILVIFPLYQVLLILFGTIFFQFPFFWEFEKKILRRMGFKRFFPES